MSLINSKIHSHIQFADIAKGDTLYYYSYGRSFSNGLEIYQNHDEKYIVNEVTEVINETKSTNERSFIYISCMNMYKEKFGFHTFSNLTYLKSINKKEQKIAVISTQEFSLKNKHKIVEDFYNEFGK